jgi:uncharacterized membrane protein YjjB (DUF3815 family)
MLLDFAAVVLMGLAVGVLYRVPRALLVYGSLNATVAWFVTYELLAAGVSVAAANFCGGLVVGAVSEVLARRLRNPATIFIIPGFFPLVPGREAYTTMRYLVEGQYSPALAMGVQTMLTAGAIAFGIFLSITVYRLTLTYYFRRTAGYADRG